MRVGKKILLIASAVFIVLQFFQPKRNNRLGTSNNDITKIYKVPENVKAILKNSCYDCHSNSTRYPWYTLIQPIGWFMNSHVEEGKSELNFNEFGSYSSRRQRSKLRSIGESIEDGSMPIASYTLIHKSAKLTSQEKISIKVWLAGLEDSSSTK